MLPFLPQYVHSQLGVDQCSVYIGFTSPMCEILVSSDSNLSFVIRVSDALNSSGLTDFLGLANCHC